LPNAQGATEQATASGAQPSFHHHPIPNTCPTPGARLPQPGLVPGCRPGTLARHPALAHRLGPRCLTPKARPPLARTRPRPPAPFSAPTLGRGQPHHLNCRWRRAEAWRQDRGTREAFARVGGYPLEMTVLLCVGTMYGSMYYAFAGTDLSLDKIWVQISGVLPKWSIWRSFMQIASSPQKIVEIDSKSLFLSLFGMVRVKRWRRVMAC
jgi:hypothetical protein